jgi:hypothetical protein
LESKNEEPQKLKVKSFAGVDFVTSGQQMTIGSTASPLRKHGFRSTGSLNAIGPEPGRAKGGARMSSARDSSGMTSRQGGMKADGPAASAAKRGAPKNHRHSFPRQHWHERHFPVILHKNRAIFKTKGAALTYTRNHGGQITFFRIM